MVDIVRPRTANRISLAGSEKENTSWKSFSGNPNLVSQHGKGPRLYKELERVMQVTDEEYMIQAIGSMSFSHPAKGGLAGFACIQ